MLATPLFPLYTWPSPPPPPPAQLLYHAKRARPAVSRTRDRERRKARASSTDAPLRAHSYRLSPELWRNGRPSCQVQGCGQPADGYCRRPPPFSPPPADAPPGTMGSTTSEDRPLYSVCNRHAAQLIIAQNATWDKFAAGGYDDDRAGADQA